MLDFILEYKREIVSVLIWLLFINLLHNAMINDPYLNAGDYMISIFVFPLMGALLHYGVTKIVEIC